MPMTYDELTQKVQDALNSSSGFLKQVETTLAVVWELCEIAKNHDDEYLAQVIAAANKAQADLNAIIAKFETFTAEKQAEFTQIKSDCETALAAIETLKIEVLAKLAAQDEKLAAQDEKLAAQDAIIDGLIKAYVYQTGQDFRQYDFAIYAGKIYQATAPFTAGGNFVTDLQKYMKPLAQDNKVVTYAAGISIEEGQNVLYENVGTGSLYVALKSFTASGTFADDAANLINYSSGIDLSDFYNKQEVSDLLATKQDKLTAGDGVSVNVTATGTIVSANMNQNSTALTIAQRNGQGQLLAKTPTKASGEVLVNADYLNSTITSLRAEFLLTENKTFSVGPSGNYTSLKAALEAASKYQNTTKNGSTFTITIQLMADYVWAETIDLRNIDLSFVSITRANTSVNVPIKTSALSTINVESLGNITCAFNMINSKITFGNVGFNIQAETTISQTNIVYFNVTKNSFMNCISNFSVISKEQVTAPYTSIQVNDNSTIKGDGSINLNFDNETRKAFASPQPILKVNNNSKFIFANIDSNNGNEVSQKQEENPSYAFEILNNSLIHQTAKITVSKTGISTCNISYVFKIIDSTIISRGRFNCQYNNLTYIYGINSTIIGQSGIDSDDNNWNAFYQYTNQGDDMSSEYSCVLNLTRCKMTLYGRAAWNSVGALNAVDCEINILGIAGSYAESIQPQGNVKNVWRFVVEGGKFYIPNGGIAFNNNSTQRYITIPSVSYGSYVGWLNFGKGCEVYIKSIDKLSVSRLTIQYAKSNGVESSNTLPKGLICLNGARLRTQVQGFAKYITNKHLTFKSITANADGTYTYSDFGGTVYEIVSLPKSLSQVVTNSTEACTSNLTNTWTENGILIKQVQ